MSGEASVETEEDFGEPPAGIASRWLAEITAYEKEVADWRTEVREIVRRYRNEEKSSNRKFALLWANVEILRPALYTRDPKPRAQRRFKDRDPAARVAATILERVLVCHVERGRVFGAAMRGAVQDMLLTGMGIGWVFLGEGPFGTTVTLEHLNWRDFGRTAGARTWEEVNAVWRISYLSREELVARFDEAGAEAPLDRKAGGAPREDYEQPDEVLGKATVYEVWDSTSRTVTWLCKGMDVPLDHRPYPLQIEGRFPCPRPMFGTTTTENMLPVPDFRQYKDQADQIDDLTSRIAGLSKALRMVGFVAGDAAPDIVTGLNSTADVPMVAVTSWAAAGGRPMDNAVAWLPVREVAETLMRLLEQREQMKRDVYELTGISDILRGQTQRVETATAQSIKAQYGAVRLRDRQQDVARFASEALEIMGTLSCEHLPAEQLAAEANVAGMEETELQHAPEAMLLLKSPGSARGYRIDVEADSTIAPDEFADQEAATNLLTGVGAYLQTAMPMLQGIAMMAPHALPQWSQMVGGMLTMAVRRFRGGEMVEELIATAMESLTAPQGMMMPGMQPGMPGQMPGAAPGMMPGTPGTPGTLAPAPQVGGADTGGLPPDLVIERDPMTGAITGGSRGGRTVRFMRGTDGAIAGAEVGL